MNQEVSMASISTKVDDETEAQVLEECDYPDRKKSDVARDALKLWLALENPEEVLQEEIDSNPE